MLVVAAGLVACVLVFVAVLLYWSPGKPKALLDGSRKPLAGSVSEKIRIPINGVEQGMFIVGKDTTKPVLLFLHGGPGMPEYFLDQTHPTGLWAFEQSAHSPGFEEPEKMRQILRQDVLSGGNRLSDGI